MQPCPRQRNEATLEVQLDHKSHWRADGTCSYCGSMNNDEFMRRLELGDVEVGPTDKAYKVYVSNRGGEPIKAIKFYFQHLTNDQTRRFVELANGGMIAMGFPGYFYTLPFFAKRAEPKCEQD